jgi:hypothetical protein
MNLMEKIADLIFGFFFEIESSKFVVSIEEQD